MVTMATSTAATISQRCLLHTETTHKDPSTVSELIVSKADNRGIDNYSFPTLNTLREIPTRISPISSTAAADDLLDDDDRRQHKLFPSPSINLEASTTINHSRTSSCQDIASLTQMLAATDAKMRQRGLLPPQATDPNCAVTSPSINLEESTNLTHSRPSPCHDITSLTQMLATTDAKMRQRGLLPPQATNPNCAVNDDTQYLANHPPHALSSPHITMMPEKEDAPLPHFAKLEIFEQDFLARTTTLLDTMAKNSQALRTLITICVELSTKVTRLECAIATIVPAPTPHHSAPVPMLHHMDKTDTTIPSNPTPAPEKQKPPFPPIRYRNNPHQPNDATPWPPLPPALFPKPAQKLKTPSRIKKVLAKSSVVRGCLGMSRTKDYLRPP